jgi:hypothetical protein
MSKAKIIGISLASVAAVAALGSVLFFWLSGRELRRTLAMQEKLLTSELSRQDANALKAELMRSIDEMDRDTLRELQGEMGDQRRQRMRASVTAYHESVGDDKVAVLDEALDRMAKTREVGFEAFSTRRGGMPRGARQGNTQRQNRERRNDQQRLNRDGNDQPGAARQDRPARPDGANRAGRGNRPGGDPNRRRTREGRDDGRGDRDRERLSDEERQQWGEYFQALRQRAEERGMEWGRGRRRG